MPLLTPLYNLDNVIINNTTHMQTNRFLVIHHFHLLLFHVRLGDEVKHLNSILKIVLYICTINDPLPDAEF